MSNKRPELPNEEELVRLPRWARVAYAVRCARRVQPLFTHAWPDAPAEHIEAVDRAITLAQASAASPDSASEQEVSVGSRGAKAATHAAVLANGGRANQATRAGDAAQATADSVYAAINTAGKAVAMDVVTVARNAVADNKIALSAARRDFELLVAMARREGWTDDSPVDAALLGPLWVEGEPEGWPSRGAYPSDQEFQRLPKRAAVLIGLRAAMRSSAFMRGTELAELEANRLRVALRSVERYCRGEQPEASNSTARDIARSFAAHREPGGAFEAAESVVYLAEASSSSGFGLDIASALREADQGLLHAKAGDADRYRSEFRSAVWADYDRVRQIMILKQNPGDRPWPPELLGDLWPYGEPTFWPGDEVQDQSLTLRVKVPPLENTQANREALRDHLQKLVLAASADHTARGGSGLRIKAVRAYVPQPADVPVGGDET